jgi:hypothetical protein
MMSAETLAKALGGRRAGAGWMARCPAHDDQEPSLSIRDVDDGKVLVYCHTRCSQEQVIAALKLRGLWAGNGSYRTSIGARQVDAAARAKCVETDRTRAVLDIWRTSRPAAGTPVEVYLRSRALLLPLPPVLRFHNGLKHPSGGSWPAMVALVARGSDGTPLAIHRTFLARDGSGKAPVEPAKMMLGPCHGGAVRLAKSGDELMVGEGIETCLAAMQATGRPAWAALSTSGLRVLDLPDDVRDVVVLADGDDPGEAAARDAALRLKSEGRCVRIARPPWGLDFNDLLMGRKSDFEEGAA